MSVSLPVSFLSSVLELHPQFSCCNMALRIRRPLLLKESYCNPRSYLYSSKGNFVFDSLIEWNTYYPDFEFHFFVLFYPRSWPFNSLWNLNSCRLANKSDKANALSEYELTELMGLEEIVNINRIPTKVFYMIVQAHYQILLVTG